MRVKPPSGCHFDGGLHAMDNLPVWAVWIAAVAVGVTPGLAILSAPMIARVIYRVASPRREVATKPGRETSHSEPVAVSASRG